MFMVEEGNTPDLNNCGFPLIIVRYPYNRQDPQVNYTNQFATTVLTDVLTNFTPPQFRSNSNVGPVLAYRPQITGQSIKHFNSLDFKIVWEFMPNILGFESQEGHGDRASKYGKLWDNFWKSYNLTYQTLRPEVQLDSKTD